MDRIIVVTALSGYGLFIVVQSALNRLTPPRQVTKTLMRVYLLAGVLPFLWLLQFLAGESQTDIMIALALYGALYTLGCFIYVIGFFGILASSLRMRMLFEIARADRKRTGEIAKSALAKSYNIPIVVSDRLDRMKGSGELQMDSGLYRVGARLSYFPVHQAIHVFLLSLYGKKRIDV